MTMPFEQEWQEFEKAVRLADMDMPDEFRSLMKSAFLAGIALGIGQFGFGPQTHDALLRAIAEKAFRDALVWHCLNPQASVADANLAGRSYAEALNGEAPV